VYSPAIPIVSVGVVNILSTNGEKVTIKIMTINVASELNKRAKKFFLKKAEEIQ
jgi:hypothetical protein